MEIPIFRKPHARASMIEWKDVSEKMKQEINDNQE